MDTEAEAQHGPVVINDNMPGKRCNLKSQFGKEGDMHDEEKDQGIQQMPKLTTELLNHVLSYTGTSTAVLAAGPAGMRTWSAANIAEWWIQYWAARLEPSCGAKAPIVCALVRAIEYGLHQTAEVLFDLSGGPDGSVFGWDYVMIAVGRVGCVRSVNMILSWFRDNREDQDLGRQSCHVMMKTACQSGQVQVVQALLDAFARHPQSYLTIAAKSGHADVVRELLNPARKLCAKANHLYQTALTIAAQSGHLDVLRELLDTSREHHCHANYNYSSALGYAVEAGHIDCVRELLDTSRVSCALANASDSYAVVFAARQGHVGIVRELLDTSRPNHAIVHLLALSSAAKNGHADVLRELVCQQHRDDPTLDVEYALDEAVSQGNLECCRILLGYPDLPPRRIDQSLLDIAATNNNLEVLTLSQEVNRLEVVKVPVLPTDVTNIILSYTGAHAAVLAAGPSGMRAWSAANTAEWMLARAHSVPLALHRAVRHGLDEPAQLILARLADQDISFLESGIVPAAILTDCAGTISMILDWMSNNSKEEGQALKASTNIMFDACSQGRLKVVKLFLNEARPSAYSPDLYLMIAAMFGHADVVKELLNPAYKHCARADALNSCALLCAAGRGKVQVLQQLLDTSREHHANANADDCLALIQAAENGHLDCVRVLLDTSRANCARANAQAHKALRMAVWKGHLDVVHELLDPSRPACARADSNGSSALLWAARGGHADVLRELLSQQLHAADPLLFKGRKALEEAVQQGNLECCQVLLGYPDLPPRNIEEAVLKKAEKTGYAGITALLTQVNDRFQPCSQLELVQSSGHTDPPMTSGNHTPGDTGVVAQVVAVPARPEHPDVVHMSCIAAARGTQPQVHIDSNMGGNVPSCTSAAQIVDVTEQANATTTSGQQHTAAAHTTPHDTHSGSSDSPMQDKQEVIKVNHDGFGRSSGDHSNGVVRRGCAMVGNSCLREAIVYVVRNSRGLFATAFVGICLTVFFVCWLAFWMMVNLVVMTK